jgi:transcriptional regulator with XRE-family HTH domain
MGRAVRARPKRLAKKMIFIRESLGLSQNEMIRWMGLEGRLEQNEISAYERGIREPNYITMLALAEAAGGRGGREKMLWMLLDDSLEIVLPWRLQKYVGEKYAGKRQPPGGGRAAPRKGTKKAKKRG